MPPVWLVCAILANCDSGHGVIASHKQLEPSPGAACMVWMLWAWP